GPPRPGPLGGRLGPRQGGTVRVGRVGRGEQQRVRDGAPGGVTEQVDALGQGELGRPEPLEEVAAAHLARVLQSGEHRVGGGEAAGQVLQAGRPAGEDAVPFEQGGHLGEGGGGGVRVPGDERPPARGGRRQRRTGAGAGGRHERAAAGQRPVGTGGATLGVGGRPSTGKAGPDRGGGGVGAVAGPDEV